MPGLLPGAAGLVQCPELAEVGLARELSFLGDLKTIHVYIYIYVYMYIYISLFYLCIYIYEWVYKDSRLMRGPY